MNVIETTPFGSLRLSWDSARSEEHCRRYIKRCHASKRGEATHLGHPRLPPLAWAADGLSASAGATSYAIVEDGPEPHEFPMAPLGNWGTRRAWLAWKRRGSLAHEVPLYSPLTRTPQPAL